MKEEEEESHPFQKNQKNDWPVSDSNDTTTAQWPAQAGEAGGMSGDYQLAVSVVVILAASVLAIVLVALLSRRGKNTGRKLDKAKKQLAAMAMRDFHQGLEVPAPGQRVTFPLP